MLLVPFLVMFCLGQSWSNFIFIFYRQMLVFVRNVIWVTLG